MGLGLMGKGGKSRNLALKGIEEEIDDSKDEDESEDEDEDDDKDEDLTFIANEIIRLLQYRKKDKDKPRNLNPLGRVRVRNPLSNALRVKVLVI